MCKDGAVVPLGDCRPIWLFCAIPCPFFVTHYLGMSAVRLDPSLDQYIAGPSRTTPACGLGGRAQAMSARNRDNLAAHCADSRYVPRGTPAYIRPVAQGSVPRVARLTRAGLDEIARSLDFRDIDVQPVVQATRVPPMRTAPRSAYIPAPPPQPRRPPPARGPRTGPVPLPPKRARPSAKVKWCGGKGVHPSHYTHVIRDDKCYWGRRYGSGCKTAGKCITTETDDKLRRLIREGRGILEVSRA